MQASSAALLLFLYLTIFKNLRESTLFGPNPLESLADQLVKELTQSPAKGEMKAQTTACGHCLRWVGLE